MDNTIPSPYFYYKEIDSLTCGIYKITNNVNGKMYIGQSINIEQRWVEHLRELNGNKHYNQHLQNSWNKYGESNFKFDIVEECIRNDLNNKERYWIAMYDTQNKRCGFNISNGGVQGCSVSEETRKKLSDSRIGRFTGKDNPFYGKTHSDEVKERVRRMAKEFSGEKHYFYGKHHTEETKDKMRETIGDSRVGELNGNAKITKEIALQIIEMLLKKTPLEKIGVQLDVSINTVRKIKYKQNWKYLTEGITFPGNKRKEVN